MIYTFIYNQSINDTMENNLRYAKKFLKETGEMRRLSLEKLKRQAIEIEAIEENYDYDYGK